jgi:hypothetical protein
VLHPVLLQVLHLLLQDLLHAQQITVCVQIFLVDVACTVTCSQWSNTN